MNRPTWKVENFRFVTSHVLVVGGVYLGKVEEYDPKGYPTMPTPPITGSVFAAQFEASQQFQDVAAAKAWCEQTIRELFLQTLDFAEET